jgi:glycosyltransferase involved in cell wall biosynthesis
MIIDVSIIVPVYNGALFIEQCINSLLDQTYRGNVEIIIINDGSTDNSLNLLNKLYGTHPKIQIYTKENGGVSSARNFGIMKSKGNFICFCDIDDSWLNNKLTTQIEIINLFCCDFLGSVLKVNNKNFILKKITLRNLLYKNYFQPSTVIMKKSVCEVVGLFDENQKYAEEGNYFMRIANAGFKCYLLNKKLTNYGIEQKSGFGESGLSANLFEMELGELKNIKYAHKNNYINFISFVFFTIFSMLKYVRRILIVKFRKYV